MKPLYEDNHIIVVEKQANIPVQQDSSNDYDLLSQIKDYLKEKYQKPGNVYVGLVHRLDRPVSGVMVFAKTSKAANRLSTQVSQHDLKKTYLAIVQGTLEPKSSWSDYLVKDEKTNTVTTTTKDKGKLALLDYEVVKTKDNLSLIKINLKTGRSHQIRVQTSSRNYPIWGDQRYNKTAKPGQQIALHAYQLTFTHPVTKEVMTFTSSQPKTGIWSIFD